MRVARPRRRGPLVYLIISCRNLHPRAAGSRSVNRKGTAPYIPPLARTQNVNMGNIIATMWPATPDVMRTILSAAAFQELTVSFDSKSKVFGIAGTPDVSGSTVLKCVIELGSA